MRCCWFGLIGWLPCDCSQLQPLVPVLAWEECYSAARTRMLSAAHFWRKCICIFIFAEWCPTPAAFGHGSVGPPRAA